MHRTFFKSQYCLLLQHFSSVIKKKPQNKETPPPNPRKHPSLWGCLILGAINGSETSVKVPRDILKPSKEVGECLEVKSKGLKALGRICNAEQRRVPRADTHQSQRSRLLKLLGTRVHSELGMEQERWVEESHSCPALPPKHSRMVWGTMPEPPIILRFYFFYSLL